ncbi:DUF2071 domain-containing protein [Flavobacteriaceae bacterium TK19130]|nr:DUF2071 domain-containing protein [Thermobacterium salinum]
MLSFLKNHPFAVEAYFKSSLVLTFALPKAELQPLLPECLTLDTFQDKWAFLALAMVQTKDLRPKGFPTFMGSDFFLIGYRLFVRYTDSRGKRLRGLYILKSETNKRKMEFFGNIFTHYNYTTTDIEQTTKGNLKTITSNRSDFHLTVDRTNEEVGLPSQSPFSKWKEARKYAGPLPFTFTYNQAAKEVLIIQGVRQNWKPKPVAVTDYQFSFIDSLKFKNPILANAFIIEEIPYYWKKGKKDTWIQHDENFKGS